MKLITFNTWGGRCGLPQIKSFFKKYQDTDIFCLQEVWQTHDAALLKQWDSRIVMNLLEEVARCLPGFQYFFRPQYKGIYGLATFIKKSIVVEKEGELFVFKDQGYENPLSVGNHARNIQYLQIQRGHDPITIINFHGLWNGQGKGDTEDRILQSQKVVKFIETVKTPFVLAGDFNLNPMSESFKIIEKICPNNLIKKNNIKSTRSSFYIKAEKFADYILTSPTIHETAFEVLPDEVSDHLALRISF